MANIKSAEKRNRQAAKRTSLNRIVRGSSRTAIKKARKAIDDSAPERREVLAAMQSFGQSSQQRRHSQK
ncbi:MAG: 30S ribosomal protein S20 [Caldilineaceae bacterium]